MIEAPMDSVLDTSAILEGLLAILQGPSRNLRRNRDAEADAAPVQGKVH